METPQNEFVIEKDENGNIIVTEQLKEILFSEVTSAIALVTNALDDYKELVGSEYPAKIVKVTQEDYDYVRPQHYKQEDGRETWEIMVDIYGPEKVADWCELTAYKYKSRMGKKPNEGIDREQGKIDWYENKAREIREKIGK